MDPKHEPGDMTEDVDQCDPREVTEEAAWSRPRPKEGNGPHDLREQTEEIERQDPQELVEELDADDGSRQAV
jgi:hypothetical protein